MQARRRALVFAAASGWLAAAHANLAAPPVPSEVAAALPGARMHGSAQLRFMGLRVYDARLWTGSAALPADWAGEALALEIQYARSLQGSAIAERSLGEMRRQGAIDAATSQRWLATMTRLFPDVKAGDRLTAVNLPAAGLRLYANGVLLGEVGDADFARRFFGIWLAPQTSEPALRLSLLGQVAR